jgi:uncharacterized protein YfdQ (DUF2303 family)
MSEDTLTPAVVDKIQRLADAASEIRRIGPNDVPAAVVPDGYRVEMYPNLLDSPTRIQQKTTHASLSSLAAYVMDHNIGECAIFADPTAGRFRVEAILDYHTKLHSVNEPLPSWCEHRATWKAEPSKEWEEWADIDGKWLDQDTFAAFIDAHIDDIVVASLDVAGDTITTPSQAKMLTIARNAVGEKNATYKVGEIAENGDHQSHSRQITITRVGKGEDSFGVPEYFAIAIPAFVETDAGAVQTPQRARLLTAVTDELKLRFQVRLPAADRIRRAAFHDAVAALGKQLETVPETGAILAPPIYFGNP